MLTIKHAQVAVKAETDFGQKNSALRAEAEILISLQGGPGVPDVVDVSEFIAISYCYLTYSYYLTTG
jgi:hypothetical protein